MTEELSLADQEESGQVFEEVSKIADGVFADIHAGKIHDRGTARERVRQAVERCAYTTDVQLALHALKWLRHHKLVKKLATRLMLDASLAVLTNDPDYQKLPK